MERDPVRQKIRDLLWERGLAMREASLAIGRNGTYLHGFLERETPKILSHQDAEKLAALLGCEAGELHHAERPPRRKRAAAKKRGTARPDEGPVPLTPVSEVEVEASAGPGALAGEFVEERARWFLPEGMIRYEGGTDSDAVRMLRVRGDSMEPELSEGDRLLIDTARRRPATGEMFVLWDGGGLVVNRVEYVNPGTASGAGDDGGAPAFGLKSANPDYADYSCLVGEVHIVGKVLWTVRPV